jgi:hypothetical protein
VLRLPPHTSTRVRRRSTPGPPSLRIAASGLDVSPIVRTNKVKEFGSRNSELLIMIVSQQSRGRHVFASPSASEQRRAIAMTCDAYTEERQISE